MQLLKLQAGLHRGWYYVISVVAFVVLLPGVIFGKMHDDEVIYYEIARNISRGLGAISQASPTNPGIFTWHIPLPSFLAAGALLIKDDIVAVRVVAAVVGAVGVSALCRVAYRLLGLRGLAVTALLMVSSFHFLRFGGRFYYDFFGFAFFWLAVGAYLEDRHGFAAFWVGWAVLARELWAGPAVVLLLWSLIRTRQSRWWAGLVPAGLALVAWVWYSGGPGNFVEYFSLFRAGRETVGVAAHNSLDVFRGMAKGWIQLGLAYGVITPLCLLALIRGKERIPLELWIAALVGAATLSVTPGFVTNGGFTQYGLLVLGFAVLIAAAGVEASLLWFPERVQAWGPLVLLGAVAAQTIAGNGLISRGNVYGSRGIYGIGIDYDRQIIALLRDQAQGSIISGIHGAFVPTARWFWVERRLNEAAPLKPTWVTVYQEYAVLHPNGDAVWSIGPYYVIHLKDPDRYLDVVEPKVPCLPGDIAKCH